MRKGNPSLSKRIGRWKRRWRAIVGIPPNKWNERGRLARKRLSRVLEVNPLDAGAALDSLLEEERQFDSSAVRRILYGMGIHNSRKIRSVTQAVRTINSWYVSGRPIRMMHNMEDRMRRKIKDELGFLQSRLFFVQYRRYQRHYNLGTTGVE
ncbi:MAG: hypothetical protein V1776_03520 [Candidatus Diapherotrites archaeon]